MITRSLGKGKRLSRIAVAFQRPGFWQKKSGLSILKATMTLLLISMKNLKNPCQFSLYFGNAL
jgi:hypothetical protein